MSSTSLAYFVRGVTIIFTFVLCWRDAEDAVYGRDGYDYDGYRLHVEFPQSGRGSGLPPSGSWQDLKDHMRETGDVCYVDVYQDGTGVVEFVRKEDMTYAVRKLDNTKFRSHEGETAYIRVKTDGPRSSSFGHSRSRSHSRSRGNFFTLNVWTGIIVPPIPELDSGSDQD
ncbi:serine/arginine-rich splicing factor 1-like [Anabas testudineus]|uniref:serine/arginine-rich splicing factor 1-like n=1 Tax=Anabas testudineus TaxID=64144 RepID=UPI000E45802A|nr:serine/arginine-rich splicing factor 1-like [Anabas testudineus]